MISKVSFRNFKALGDVTIPLGRLSVFVGPNASGKTSILEGIHYVARAIHADPPSIFTGSRSPRRLYSGPEDDELEFKCSVDATLRLRIRLGTHSNWKRVETLENGIWSYSLEAYSIYEEPEAHAEHTEHCKPHWVPLEESTPDTRRLLSRCGSTAIVRLEASRLAVPFYSDREMPRVETDGSGLASTLLFLKGNDDVAFESVVKNLRTLVPAVRGIRFRKSLVPDGDLMGDALTFDTDSGTGIPANLMSEGTLLLLGILTILNGPQKPQIVLIDDVDRALHPRAQRQFVELLHELLKERNDLQIVATTHSPYLLDALTPEEVMLTTLKDDGFAVCAPLRDHHDFPRWKDEMSPGEFWSAVGEDWVREQAASGAAR